MFNIGDHVVCIDDHEPSDGWEPLQPVVSGLQYVVRAVWENDEGITIQLTGMPDGYIFQQLCGYAPERFRRLDTMKQEARRAAELTEQMRQIGFAKQPLVSKGMCREVGTNL